MPVIDLSAGWVTNMMPRLFRNNGTVNPANSSASALLNSGFGYSANAVGTICLMKGTIPPTITTHTTLSARSADVLCRFQAGTQVAGDFVTSQLTVNPAIVSTQYVAALAAGTATWFWWYVIPTLGSGQPDPAATLIHQIIGTVGVTGAGTDLEMATVNITAGELYRIVNLRLQFPTTWTY